MSTYRIKVMMNAGIAWCHFELLASLVATASCWPHQGKMMHQARTWEVLSTLKRNPPTI